MWFLLSPFKVLAYYGDTMITFVVFFFMALESVSQVQVLYLATSIKETFSLSKI